MYACICHAVTEREVNEAIAEGAKSVRAVSKATGAGSNCGSCVNRLNCLLSAAKEAAGEPVREPRRRPLGVRLPQHQPGCPAVVPALG